MFFKSGENSYDEISWLRESTESLVDLCKYIEDQMRYMSCEYHIDRNSDVAYLVHSKKYHICGETDMVYWTRYTTALIDMCCHYNNSDVIARCSIPGRFSFLRGIDETEEYVDIYLYLGDRAIWICNHNSTMYYTVSSGKRDITKDEISKMIRLGIEYGVDIIEPAVAMRKCLMIPFSFHLGIWNLECSYRINLPDYEYVTISGRDATERLVDICLYEEKIG